jgi:hypothetical protein
LEVGWGGVDWIGLAQDRDRWRALVYEVINLQVPQNAGKLSSGFTTGGLSSSAQLHRVSFVITSFELLYPVTVPNFMQSIIRKTYRNEK